MNPQRVNQKSPSKILIVEDDRLLSRSLARSLEDSGYEICGTAVSGQESCRMAMDTRPDLILMDILLQGDMDGIDAAIQIQSELDVPIVYVTAHTEENLCSRAQLTRPYGHLVKPLSVDSLRITLETALSRHEMERRLRESEARYRAVVEDQTEFICRFLPDGVLTFVNQAYSNFVGKGSDELLGRSFFEHLSDGERKERQDQLAALDSEYPTKSSRVRTMSPKGEIRWLEWKDRALWDSRGRLVEYQSVGRDITTEIDLDRQVRESQKMKAVGSLAGGLAHEFNNLLQIVGGYAELLLQERDVKDGGADELQSICDAAERGRQLVNHLLAFAGKIEPKPRPADLNELVIQTDSLLYRTISKSVEITLNLASDLWRIMADPAQIEQVLLNIGLHAAEAAAEGGSLVFGTSNVTLDEEYCRNLPITPGDYVRLEISYTGQRMDEGSIERVFEPYFGGVEPGERNGLGLAVAFGMVRSHQGYIKCASDKGGATFTIHLPVISRDRSRSASTAGGSFGGVETILVVDDEHLITNLAERILQNAGYTAIKATDAKQAVKIFAERHSEIDLVVLDLIMPQVDGLECLEQLRRIDPKMKAIFSTGCALYGQTRTTVARKSSGCVEKPFRMDEMLRTIRQVLDED